MKQIDEQMLDAVRNCRTWGGGNTMVFCDGLSHHFTVFLHGNQIAEGQTGMGSGFTVEHATFAGWPTNTTARRLRALGVDTKELRKKEGYAR